MEGSEKLKTGVINKRKVSVHVAIVTGCITIFGEVMWGQRGYLSQIPTGTNLADDSLIKGLYRNGSRECLA